jgi:tetratricopeptide (TPR) repeat protein
LLEAQALAAESYEQAIEVLRPAVAAKPESIEMRRRLALALDYLGMLYGRRRQIERAFKLLHESRSILETLALENPRVNTIRFDQARNLDRLGTLHREAGNPQEALRLYE